MRGWIVSASASLLYGGSEVPKDYKTQWKDVQHFTKYFKKETFARKQNLSETFFFFF